MPLIAFDAECYLPHISLLFWMVEHLQEKKIDETLRHP